MTLSTKYDRGDKVFVLHRNEVREMHIASVIITIDPISGEQTNRYVLSTNVNVAAYLFNVKGSKPEKFKEYRLFKTKAELLKSL